MTIADMWKSLRTEWEFFKIRLCPHWWRAHRWHGLVGQECRICGVFRVDASGMP